MISCNFPPIAFTVNGKRLRSQNNDRKTTRKIILSSRIMCESELFTPSQGRAYLSLLEANEQAVRVSLSRLGVSGSAFTNGGGLARPVLDLYHSWPGTLAKVRRRLESLLDLTLTQRVIGLNQWKASEQRGVPKLGSALTRPTAPLSCSPSGRCQVRGGRCLGVTLTKVFSKEKAFSKVRHPLQRQLFLSSLFFICRCRSRRS